MSTPVETLCKGFDPEFATFLNYSRSLRFDDKPDYAYLRKLLRDLFIREGYKYDAIFDWTIIRAQETLSNTIPSSLDTRPPGDGKAAIAPSARATQGSDKRNSEVDDDPSKGQSSASKLVERTKSSTAAAVPPSSSSRRPGQTPSGSFPAYADPYGGALTVGDANRSSFTRSGVGLGVAGLGVSSSTQNASSSSLPNTVTSTSSAAAPAPAPAAQSGSTSARRRAASGSGEDVKMTDVSNNSNKNLSRPSSTRLSLFHKS